jgi:hypothetical protein
MPDEGRWARWKPKIDEETMQTAFLKGWDEAG